VDLTHKEIFERYIHAGAITRNPDAIAAMFTEDGVLDASLVPEAQRTTMSLVQIFRLRDGQIAMLRDYFAELPSLSSDDHPS
jgi:limonene-1,2-epoxide hydrolase